MPPTSQKRWPIPLPGSFAGGPITEIRARVDSAGVPITLKLTEGQELYAV
jgi:hypothetical protein